MKVPKRSQSQKILQVINVTGIVKVLKQEEDYPFTETYWTETVDISARTEDGRKMFEFFHILTVPEGELGVFERLRRQARKSLMSELEESSRGLLQN